MVEKTQGLAHQGVLFTSYGPVTHPFQKTDFSSPLSFNIYSIENNSWTGFKAALLVLERKWYIHNTMSLPLF